MGITHFEDLSASQLLDVMSLKWSVSEKLDGSFLAFGLDEEGRFYTSRKDPNIRIYEVEDWPAKGWTNPFRAAHAALYTMVSEWQELGLIDPQLYPEGVKGTVEILNGYQPNTIKYYKNNVLVVTDWSGPPILSPNSHSYCTTSVDQYISNGKVFTKERVTIEWTIGFNEPNPHYLQLVTRDNEIMNAFIDLKMKLNQEIWPGWQVKDILEVKLNKRHPRIAEAEWADFKAKVKEKRPKLEAHIQKDLLEIKRLLVRYVVPSLKVTPRGTEGLVIKTALGTVFKIVDRPAFTKLNRRAHIVKYWLVGGRRPARPSFMSRTTNWPKAKRLKRLAVLLKRYKKHHKKLVWRQLLNNMPVEISYNEELHQRMLILFADVRERIKDGR